MRASRKFSPTLSLEVILFWVVQVTAAANSTDTGNVFTHVATHVDFNNSFVLKRVTGSVGDPSLHSVWCATQCVARINCEAFSFTAPRTGGASSISQKTCKLSSNGTAADQISSGTEVFVKALQYGLVASSRCYLSKQCARYPAASCQNYVCAQPATPASTASTSQPTSLSTASTAAPTTSTTSKTATTSSPNTTTSSPSTTPTTSAITTLSTLATTSTTPTTPTTTSTMPSTTTTTSTTPTTSTTASSSSSSTTVTSTSSPSSTTEETSSSITYEPIYTTLEAMFTTYGPMSTADTTAPDATFAVTDTAGTYYETGGTESATASDVNTATGYYYTEVYTVTGNPDTTVG